LIETTDLEELSNGIWFEEYTGTIIIGIDRVSLTLSLDEMWDLCESIVEAKERLESHPDVVVGTYVENGQEKKAFIKKPDDDDLN